MTIVGIVIIGGGSGGTNRLMMAQQHKEKVQQCYNVNRIFSIRQHVCGYFLRFVFYIFAVCLYFFSSRRYGRTDDDDDDDDGCVLKYGPM